VPTSKQRREAARRHLERQLERRQQRDARRRQVTLVGTVVGTLVVFAIVITSIVMLTNDSKKSTTAASTPTASATPSTSASSTAKPGECNFVAGGTASRKVSLPPAKEPTTGIATVKVTTTQGDMTFRLDRSKTPCTVASFASLIKQKYYDNTPCHRLTTSGIFVLQCGDPTGLGTGGPGYTIPDEVKGTEKYTAGVLAMANTGQPNTGGGQFFIVYKTTPLPAQYTVFGTVTTGLDIVNKVAKAGSDNKNSSGDGAPKLPIKIASMTITG
jgi:peptidyl-prolyl cis-trans isomerase B (cyclophilin B)